MCEFDSSWHFYDEDELALTNNITVDSLADAGYERAKSAMNAGLSYIIMCAQNLENGELVNISLTYSSIDYSKYITIEDMLDATANQLEEIFYSDESQSVNITRSTATSHISEEKTQEYLDAFSAY